MIAALDQTEITALTDLVRLLAVVPRLPDFSSGGGDGWRKPTAKSNWGSKTSND